MDRDCFGKELSVSPSAFQMAFRTINVLSWNNNEDFNSPTNSSIESALRAAALSYKVDIYKYYTDNTEHYWFDTKIASVIQTNFLR